MTHFSSDLPCHPTDLVKFRGRIGADGVTLIFKASAQLRPAAAAEEEVVIDTTVQEKNITHPSDTKLYRKISDRCWQLADASSGCIFSDA